MVTAAPDEPVHPCGVGGLARVPDAAARARDDGPADGLARVRLDKSMITAPFDGVVGLRKVSIGDFVDVGQDMVNLEQIDPLKADFRVADIYLGAVRPGQPIELVVDASDIPSEITISLAGLEIGDSIHISDVKLPKGATPAIDDRDFAIATIVPPTVPTVEDEELEAEVAEAQAAEAASDEEPVVEPNDDHNDDDKITPQKKD